MTDNLRDALNSVHRTMVHDSRDWALNKRDAWLYAILIGWACEDDHAHDDICMGDGPLTETAARHGWDTDTVARLRTYRAALADLGPKPAASSPTTAGSCAHCPDGHTPADRGSQPWTAYVGPERDGDGQPMTIHVARSAGAHVAESDAEWIRQRLNPPERPREPQPRPYTGRLGRGA